jgi:hypothetical protein
VHIQCAQSGCQSGKVLKETIACIIDEKVTQKLGLGKEATVQMVEKTHQEKK